MVCIGHLFNFSFALKIDLHYQVGFTRQESRTSATAYIAATDPGPAWPAYCLVVPGDQMALDLLHGVESHAHDDQQRGSTKLKRHLELLLHEGGQHAHRRDV